MTRAEKFRALAAHGWLKSVFKKLTAEERQIAEDFIRENDALDKGAFELRINRMFLDRLEKPKHWKEILELLTCANSAVGKEAS